MANLCKYEHAKNLRHRIKKLVEKLNMNQSVILSGFVSDPQVIRMLNASKIFVLPSTEEGFGLTVLEAVGL